MFTLDFVRLVVRQYLRHRIELLDVVFILDLSQSRELEDILQSARIAWSFVPEAGLFSSAVFTLIRERVSYKIFNLLSKK